MKIAFILIFMPFNWLISQEINFKDSSLLKALLSHNPAIDLNNDFKIDRDEAQKVKSLELNNKNISSVQGLEFFTSIENLQLQDNQIDTLIISDFNFLKNLNCRTNKMNYLLVNNCAFLDELIAGQNELKDFLVTNCPNITTIYLQENLLKDVFLQNLVKLNNLVITDNQISWIDLSKNPNLFQLHIDMNKLKVLDISNNPKIRFIYVGSEVTRKMTKQQKLNEQNIFLEYPPLMDSGE